MITRNNGISISKQIKDDFRDRLTKFQQGEQISTEIELSKYYGVSRGTIRKVIDDFVNEGILYRIQGKGIFKGGIHNVSKQMPVLNSISIQILKLGYEPGISNIILNEIVAPSHIYRLLETNIEQPLWKLERNRLANNSIFAYACAYIKKDVIPNLKPSDLQLSLMSMLVETFNINIGYSHTNYTAILADSFIAEKLQCNVGDPVMKIVYIGYGDDHLPFLVDILYARGDKYSLSIEETSPYTNEKINTSI